MTGLGVLEVSLQNAVDVARTALVGQQHPYCILKCDGQEYTSSIHRGGGCNPKWNQTFLFKGVSDTSVLQVEVSDHRQLLPDTRIGVATIPLSDVAQGGEARVSAPLVKRDGKEQGSLTVTLKFAGSTAKDAGCAKAGPPDVGSLPDQVPPAVPAAVPEPATTPEGNWVLPTYGGRDVTKEYVFGDKLGEGAFGTTHLVTSVATGKTYACKTLKKASLTSPEAVEDVRREVQVMHHLSGHPHIVQLVNVYEDADHVHLVLELCSGGELFDRITSRPSGFTERDAATVMRTVLSVVSYCHRMGVMHRDLKPENFLLADPSEEAPVKVMDFGMSLFVDGDKTLSDLVGSPYYIAPEVLAGNYRAKADVWSCGVIMYILLSGLPPFYGETEEEIFDSIMRDPVNLEGDPWPLISPYAKDCIARMLERDVSKRVSADEALQHNWMRENGNAPDTPIDLEVLQRIKKFSGMNKLKKKALTAIAAHLPAEEVKGLSEIFRGMDRDKSGTVSVDELRAGLLKQGSTLSKAQASALLKASDVDGDGQISQEEFVAATMHANKTLKDEQLRHAFAQFDLDGDGKLTTEELQKVLQEQGVKAVQRIIKSVDRDADGKIDYKEFCAMMCDS